MYLISLLMASNCSCNITASVWASAWPQGERRSTELKMVSRSSSISDISTSLSKAWATLASTLACWARSQSCSLRVCTYTQRKHVIKAYVAFKGGEKVGKKEKQSEDTYVLKVEIQKEWKREKQNKTFRSKALNTIEVLKEAEWLQVYTNHATIRAQLQLPSKSPEIRSDNC